MAETETVKGIEPVTEQVTEPVVETLAEAEKVTAADKQVEAHNAQQKDTHQKTLPQLLILSIFNCLCEHCICVGLCYQPPLRPKALSSESESENEHENNLVILSSIGPITTTSTSTGDSECVSK